MSEAVDNSLGAVLDTFDKLTDGIGYGNKDNKKNKYAKQKYDPRELTDLITNNMKRLGILKEVDDSDDYNVNVASNSPSSSRSDDGTSHGNDGEHLLKDLFMCVDKDEEEILLGGGSSSPAGGGLAVIVVVKRKNSISRRSSY